MTRRFFVSPLLVLLLALCVLFGCDNLEEQTLAVGKRAPDIAVKNAEDKVVGLEQYQGKPVLLEFWSKTCGSCMASIPKLNEIQSENASRLVVIGIATDISADELNAFAKENDIHYPLVADQLGITEECYGIIGYPTMIYINREHVLEKMVEGLTTNPNWKNDIAQWVNAQY